MGAAGSRDNGLCVILHGSRKGTGGRGGGSRDAGPGVSGDRFRTRETGTMVWWAGALLSVVSN